MEASAALVLVDAQAHHPRKGGAFDGRDGPDPGRLCREAQQALAVLRLQDEILEGFGVAVESGPKDAHFGVADEFNVLHEFSRD